MPRFVEMDNGTTLLAQMEQKTGTVILINAFTVEPEDEEQFLRAWRGDAAVMKRQPGFISTQLHKGIGASRLFLNYAVWESTADFARAFQNHEFRARLKDYPPKAVASPHLFQRVAVGGICGA
jgi:heme-degrading monooxygenase HmoA